jgi:hypothetical protein
MTLNTKKKPDKEAGIQRKLGALLRVIDYVGSAVAENEPFSDHHKSAYYWLGEAHERIKRAIEAQSIR